MVEQVLVFDKKEVHLGHLALLIAARRLFAGCLSGKFCLS